MPFLTESITVAATTEPIWPPVLAPAAANYPARALRRKAIVRSQARFAAASL